MSTVKPGALILLSDTFCGYDSEGFSEGRDVGLSAVPSTPVALILPEAITSLSLKWGMDDHQVWNQGLPLSKRGAGQLERPGASSAVK